MNLKVAGIECKYDVECTDSRSHKCFNCKNNTHHLKNSKGSYFIQDEEAGDGWGYKPSDYNKQGMPHDVDQWNVIER